MIQVAMLSKWHVHAPDYADQAAKHPDISITAVWDEDAERGRAWAQELGVPFEEQLDDILARSDVDGVIIDAPTSMHRDIMLKAAKAKKHIFSEKVLALTAEDCEEVIAEAKEQGIQLMLSLPQLSQSLYLYAKKAMDDGLLGDLTTLRCRMAHNGGVPAGNKKTGWLPPHFYDPQTCGGGALIDLGAHPIYLSNRLAGPAKEVSARMSKHFADEVEDQAVVTVQYENGAIGILETSFVSFGSPFLLELYGTHGVLLMEGESVRLNTIHGEKPGEWQEIKDLPAPTRMPMEQWADQILRATAPDIQPEDMIELTRMNEAAYTSNSAGKPIAVSR
ncbi:Gfo/Idh/MocA family oxidoreductase [Bacillaceae bacterium SIJ1]|uniref:Gfo/Idh/MocA family protein n=1 Tax=Litoribacterium kuwaitense TaxID=1398745 RepID=UPI0013EBBE1D|nr:Gfo/Idh/MocA family oxidoreductase [Litoribacterium kuwaitense]NGP46303.1 Gfo/Idh/MocA family oxidoreductase [Litoribacterium kuwaitense]